MSLPIKLIPGTNVHHLHGYPVTSKGRPLLQEIVTFTMKGDKTYTAKKPLHWFQLLAKTRVGVPPHLMEHVDQLEFKTVKMPTYEDWISPIPVIVGPITYKDKTLHIMPGFIHNAMDAEGVFYEVYQNKKREWYWEEVYPNQLGNYDLISSVDGDLIELSESDLEYLFLGDENPETKEACTQEKLRIEKSFMDYVENPTKVIERAKKLSTLIEPA